MKFFRGQLKLFLLLYVPLNLIGIALTYFFPHLLIRSLEVFFPIFFLLAFFILINKRSGYRFPSSSQKQINFWHAWAGWVFLEISIFLVQFFILHSTQISETNQSIASLKTIKAFLLTGLFPWPFYILLGFSFAYFEVSESSLFRSILKPFLRTAWKQKILSLGIDLCIKQTVLFSGVMTFSLLIVYSTHFINPAYDPRVKFVSSLLIATLVFTFLNSTLWKRISRFYWLEHYPFRVLLLIVGLALILLINLCQIIINFIAPYLPQSSNLGLALPWPWASQIDIWFLTKYIWEILMAPLAAYFISKLVVGFKIRTSLFQALFLPVLLGVLFIFDYFWMHNWIAQSLMQIKIPLLLEIFVYSLAFLITISFLKLPESLKIIQLNDKKPLAKPSLLAIRHFYVLLSTFILIYLLTGIPILLLYTSGIIIPMLLIGFLACLSLVIRLK